MPRKYVPKTRGPAYTKEDLANAVADVKNKNMTYRVAAEYYNVPVAVISQRINGRMTSIEASRGRKNTFNQETETKIVECLLARANAGYPCDKDELLNLIQEYVVVHNLVTPFTDNRPGNDWYYAFIKRHKEVISLKKPEHLQKCRKNARRPDVIYSFYKELEKTFTRLHLDTEDKAAFVFNADETGFKSDPNRLRAIGAKGKALVRISGGSGRDSTTVLACVAADGSTIPPLIVFKGAGVQARWTSEKAFPGTLYAASRNGWMEEPQFYTWFTKAFIPYVDKIRVSKLSPEQAAVLIYDGHSSHISVRIIQEAISNNITLIKLPSHLTDMIQPLDKCVFGPVKTFWEKKLVNFGRKNMGKGTGRLTKSQFVEMLGDVWIQAMKSSNIISGFRSCGIFPVDKSKFPISAFKKEELNEYLKKASEPEKNIEEQDTNGVPEVANLPATVPVEKTSQLKEKDPASCQHLSNETCTSSCQKSVETGNNSDLETSSNIKPTEELHKADLEQNENVSHSKISFQEIFFKTRK